VLVLQAPAKINLCLRVLGKRPDGYHDIDSVFAKVSLFDTLSFRAAPGIELTTEGFDAGPSADNLVVRAARALRAGRPRLPGVRMHLVKRIPSGAGLGGGSSDAAAALRGLDRFWGLGLTPRELHGLAASLGSDVPFFLHGAAARVSGRGEVVEPFTPARSWPVLLVKPRVSVSTAWAYGALSLTKDRQKNKLSCFGLAENRLSSLAAGLANDFEAPVFRRHPEILRIRDGLLRQGALAAVLSGSGSAVVGFFDRGEEAARAVRAFPDCWSAVARTLVDPDESRETGVEPIGA